MIVIFFDSPDCRGETVSGNGKREEDMQIKKFWRSAIAVTLFAVLVTGCGKVNASANASVADIIRQHIAEENADDEADAENKSEAGTEAEAGNRSDTESGSEAETRENSEVPTSARSEYSFELEGKTYSVPFPLTAMRENGWEPRGITWEELEEKDIGGYTISFLHFTRGGKEEVITAFIVSAPGNRQKIIDCQVYKIEVGQTSLDPLPYSFALSNGIKLGDNLDSVRQLMGEPSHVFDYDQYSEAVYDIDSRNLNIGFFQSKEHAFIYQIDIEVDSLSDMFF